jgi:nitrogen regulatory protein PII
MTKYYLKKRIDIIVEAPLLRALTSTLDQARVPGYSVLPILEGRGMLNTWNSQGQVSDAVNMVALLCIVDPAHADEVVDAVFSAIRDRIGFVTMSDVFVLRPARFRAAATGSPSASRHESFAIATMHP